MLAPDDFPDLTDTEARETAPEALAIPTITQQGDTRYKRELQRQGIPKSEVDGPESHNL